MTTQVAIAGAGIAGLTTALALADRGFGATLVERSATLAEAGAGIQLSPNATRILLALGLGPALERHWVEPETIVVRRGRDGATLARMPVRAMAPGWGAPFAVIHRADLQAVLVDAVRARGIDLRLEAAADSIHQDGDGVHLGTAAGKVQADAAVIADGVWSRLRPAVLDDGAPRFTGRRAYRTMLSTAQAPSWLTARDTGLWLGPAAHLVHYPVKAGAAVNLVAVVTDADADGGWSRPGGSPAQAFAGWCAPVRELLASVGDWQSWPLFDRPAPARLAQGRLALAGDAGHPTLPFLAQGGAMAIEDAAVLAATLADGTRPIEQRLSAYSSARVPRVARIVEEARGNDARYHWPAPLSAVRDAGLKLLGGERLLARYDWLYGWHPPAVDPTPAAA